MTNTTRKTQNYHVGVKLELAFTKVDTKVKLTR